MIIILIISLLFVCILSSMLAGAFYLMGFNFFVAFLIIASLISFIGTMWNRFMEYKTRTEIAKASAMNELATSYQSIKLPCAYCTTPNVIKYVFNSDNIFECPNCKNKNKIMVNMMSARTTEPLVADTVVADIFKKIEEAEGNK